MTTLENRPGTALLIVDMQKGVIASAHARALVVANVGILVEKARRDRIPVIWVQHFDKQLARGSDEWRIVPELSPGYRSHEPLLDSSDRSRAPGPDNPDEQRNLRRHVLKPWE
jgi:nicotinamidase-related amidase